MFHPIQPNNVSLFVKHQIKVKIARFDYLGFRSTLGGHAPDSTASYQSMGLE